MVILWSFKLPFKYLFEVSYGCNFSHFSQEGMFLLEVICIVSTITFVFLTLFHSSANDAVTTYVLKYTFGTNKFIYQQDIKSVIFYNQKDDII